MLDFKGLVLHFSYFSIYQLLSACSLWNITKIHLKYSDFDHLSDQSYQLSGVIFKPVKFSVALGMCLKAMSVWLDP